MTNVGLQVTNTFKLYLISKREQRKFQLISINKKATVALHSLSVLHPDMEKCLPLLDPKILKIFRFDMYFLGRTLGVKNTFI